MEMGVGRIAGSVIGACGAKSQLHGSSIEKVHCSPSTFPSAQRSCSFRLGRTGNGQQGSMLLTYSRSKSSAVWPWQVRAAFPYSASSSGPLSFSLIKPPLIEKTSILTNTGRKLVNVQAGKRQMWTAEPLVNGKVTKRAMYLIRDLRMWMQNEVEEEIPLGILERWVASKTPQRRDWLDVLNNFDNKNDRELLFKLSEWSFKEEWFEANVRDYTKLIERYGKAGRVADSERLIQEMETKGISIDMVTLTVMVSVFGKARQLEQAVEMFETAKERGFIPDTKAYNALMVGYGYAGQPQRAELLLEEMIAAGVVADTETYCGLINGYGRIEQPDQAKRVFELMVIRGVKVTTKVYTALLNAYGKAGDPESARAVFDIMRSSGFKADDRAICLMLNAYEKRDLMNRAVGMVVELENAGVKPGPESLTALIGWFGRVGLIDEAEELFYEMVKKELRITPKTCALMYKAYGIAGQLGKAKEFMEEMRTKGLVFTEQSASGFSPITLEVSTG